MSQAIPQGPFYCLSSTLQFPPQPINKKNFKKRHKTGGPGGLIILSKGRSHYLKCEGRLHCFPADDGSHSSSVPGSGRAAFTSAGVHINTTRRHDVSLKAEKRRKTETPLAERRWLQANRPSGRPSCITEKKTDKGRKKPTWRCGVGFGHSSSV